MGLHDGVTDGCYIICIASIHQTQVADGDTNARSGGEALGEALNVEDEQDAAERVSLGNAYVDFDSPSSFPVYVEDGVCVAK